MTRTQILNTEGRFPSAELSDVSNTFFIRRHRFDGRRRVVLGPRSHERTAVERGILGNKFGPPRLPNGAASMNAIGWIIGSNVTWHSGKVSGFHAINAVFPDEYAVVVLGNEYEEGSAIVLWQPEQLVIAIHQLLNPELPLASNR